MRKFLVPLTILILVAMASPAYASLTYHGIETTINDDTSINTRVTLKFSGPESSIKYSTTTTISSFNTSGSFGPVACVLNDPKTLSCSLSGITDEKNTLFIDIQSKNAVNYSYGRYHFIDGFTSSLGSDRLFSVVTLPESATLAEVPTNNSYKPSYGEVATDGKHILVVWDSSNTTANQQLDFSVDYNRPPITGPVTRYILIGAGIVIVFVVIVAFFYIRRTSRFSKSKAITSVLNADEKRVVDIVSASGNGSLQKHIVRESNFSKAKVSRLVKSLNKRGVIKIEPVSGRENRILMSAGKSDRPVEEKKAEVKPDEETKQ